MGAVQRTIEQVIADAWGNDEGGVTVHVLEEGTHLEVQRALAPDEARALAAALVMAADAVTEDRHRDEQGPGEPPAPRGDAITASGHRRTQSVAKTPQITAEALGPVWSAYPCGRPDGHDGPCAP